MDISRSTPHQDPQPHPDTVTPADTGGGPGAATPDPSGVAGSANEVDDGSASGAARPGPNHLVRYLAVYSVLRLGLVAALTAVLAFFMPLIVALLFAIIAQLPLAWLLFAGPRRRVNQAMALASAQRRAERARLQSALTGDVDPG